MKKRFLTALLPLYLMGWSQPPVCKSTRELTAKSNADSSQEMLELNKICPAIQIDLRYAISNNFVGRRMYPKGTDYTFLRREPARAICNVHRDLAEKGLGLKIWDAYRPYSVTKAFWDLIGDERYVANPAKGSGHNRGVSVDLTIIRLDTGEELPMGTDFDHFSDSAHQDFTALPGPALENRKMLRTLMEKHGFLAYKEEWWHYSWPSPERYPLLDISFQRLRKRH